MGISSGIEASRLYLKAPKLKSAELVTDCVFCLVKPFRGGAAASHRKTGHRIPPW